MNALQVCINGNTFQVGDGSLSYLATGINFIKQTSPSAGIAAIGFYNASQDDFDYYRNTKTAFSGGLNGEGLTIKVLLETEDQLPITFRRKDMLNDCVAIDVLSYVTEILESEQRLYTVDVNDAFIDTVLGTNPNPGHYQVEIGSSGDCDNGSYRQELHFIVTPDQGYSLSFHFNDHLGSTVVSDTYSTFGNEDLFNDAMIIGDDILLPSGQNEVAYLTPYGERPEEIDVIAQKARYTDHEWDDDQGFNYMKGRYQLPKQAKFNRPDPMRDWDWTRPHSFNLYEYVRNDSVNATDPTGFLLMPQVVGAVAGGLINLVIQKAVGNEVGWNDFWIGAAAGVAATTVGPAALLFIGEGTFGTLGAGLLSGVAATAASTTTSNVLNDKPFWEGVSTESLLIGGTVSMITTGLVGIAAPGQEALASGVGGIMGSATEEAISQFVYVFDFSITTEKRVTSSENENGSDSLLETDKEGVRILPTEEADTEEAENN